MSKAFTSHMPFFPEQGSDYARQVDDLYLFIGGVSAFMTVLIASLIIIFAIRYRRRPKRRFHPPKTNAIWLELTWTVIPLLISLVMFLWGARLYLYASTPPADADEIFVVAKQWMWKFQHQNGDREINQLHVPTGRPIKLIMISEDVIHSFFAPIFRVKMDVLPDRYTFAWFEPTKPGVYHLFCAEFCGTSHSQMRGKIIVMPPQEYATWLESRSKPLPPEASGAELFHTHGCATCHQGQNANIAPALEELYGSTVTLNDGSRIVADETYIRRSIVNPRADVVAGYQPIMPAYEGRLTETQIVALVEYIKSLAGGTKGPTDNDTEK